MIVEQLKKSIINSAISGTLTNQDATFRVDSKFNDYRDDLMFSIPENWKCVKLLDISDYGKNVSICGKDISEEEWILELEDIEKDSGVLLKKIYQQERKAVSNKNKFSKGNVLYGKLRPYLNKCIIADDDGYCSTEIVPMNLDENIINKYLQLVLMSPYYLNYVNEKSYGTKMPRLGTKDAQNSLIPLPPIEEQQRIIETVERLFEKLEDIKPLEQQLNMLKTNFPMDMKKSILLEAYNGAWSLEKYEDWEELELKKVAEIFTGNSISESVKKSKYMNLDSGFNYIATKDLNFDHSIDYENGVKIPFDEKGFKYANKKSILMCIEGGSAGKKIGIVEEKVCFGNKLCKFECNSDIINYKYLYYFLQSPLFVKNFNNNLTGIIGGVSINKIKELLIKYPSLEEQQRIVDKIEKLLFVCNEIEIIINL